MDNYDPSVAYFIMTAINERFAGVLPYPPIGQIMLAIEHIGELRQESVPRGGGQRLTNAALILATALLNFPNIDTAKKAWTVFMVGDMRDWVKRELCSVDEEVGKFITA